MWLAGVSHVTFRWRYVTTARTLSHSYTWAILQMYLWGTPCTTVRAFILSAHYICTICSHVLCLQQSNLNRKGETQTILVIYYTVISKEERVILCQLETGWKPCQCSPWRRPEHCGRNVGKIFSPFLAGTENPLLFMQQPAEKTPLQ